MTDESARTTDVVPDDGWHAHIMRSPLDARVWCVILPDADMMTGALHASTSLRRAKEYAMREATLALMDRDSSALVWVRDSDGWVLVERDNMPVKPRTEGAPSSSSESSGAVDAQTTEQPGATRPDAPATPRSEVADDA